MRGRTGTTRALLYGGDSHVRVVGCEVFEIRRIVGQDEPSSEPDGGSYHERIDGHLAAGADGCQEVTCKPSDTDPTGYDARVAAAQFQIDSFVSSTAAVELDQGG
jgi:hypothetical protein